MTGANHQRFDVAYVMTHYPRVALSFIANEIDALERLGGRVHALAINLPSEKDLGSVGERERSVGTTYLKQSWGRVAADFVSLLLRRPLKTLFLNYRAARSARADLALMVRRMAHLAQAASVARYCQRHHIRHLHGQFGLTPATIAWFAAEILNFDRKSPRAGWSFTIHGFHDFVDEAVARLDLKAAYASFVVCVSDFTRSQLFRIVDPEHWHKAHVIRCGVDLDALPLRRRHAPGSCPRIISVGRLSAEKGQIVLVQACQLLAQRGTPFQLILVGSGPFEPEIRAEVQRLELSDRIQFRGELPPQEVRRELERSDVFCLASFSEGLPVSIMEAMAVGVPVVSTAIAGIPELAINGETALTVPPANPEAMADALELMLANQHLRSQFAKAARQRVEELHDIRATAAALHGLFTKTTVQSHDTAGCGA